MSAPFPSEVVRRRAEIGDALSSLESALARPAGPPEHWSIAVIAALRRLDQLVSEQVVAYTMAEGVFEEVVERAPRLVSHVERCRTLIATLSPRIQAILTTVASSDADRIREDALRVMADVVRARQKLADLVWDAYSVDLGGNSS